MRLSDFPPPFIAVVLLSDSQRGPQCHSRPKAGSPGSRVSNFHACAGSRTTRGRNSSCDGDPFRVAFRTYDTVGPSKLFSFRGSIPGLHVPLPTLRPCPCGQRRMTRGAVWIANPSRCRTCTCVTHRFVPAHFAVGIALSGDPPHRSRRAELPHRAPTSSHDAQALFEIRM